jgi:hypothetical protein
MGVQARHSIASMTAAVAKDPQMINAHWCSSDPSNSSIEQRPVLPIASAAPRAPGGYKGHKSNSEISNFGSL